MPAAISVAITAGAVDIAGETARFAAGDPAIGAIVTFAGQCRDEGGRLAALDIEHYPGMAEAQIRKVAEAAAARWPLHAIRIVHRHGRIVPGETIVFVATASGHRRAAFEAADFLMDYLKSRAPFWKKEIGADGIARDWVSARADDDDALGRWE